MTPFVLDYCDTNHFVIHDAKKDQIGKSLHQGSSILSHKDAASIARSLVGSFRASGAIWSILITNLITE